MAFRGHVCVTGKVGDRKRPGLLKVALFDQAIEIPAIVWYACFQCHVHFTTALEYRVHRLQEPSDEGSVGMRVGVGLVGLSIVRIVKVDNIKVAKEGTGVQHGGIKMKSDVAFAQPLLKLTDGVLTVGILLQQLLPTIEECRYHIGQTTLYQGEWERAVA